MDQIGDETEEKQKSIDEKQKSIDEKQKSIDEKQKSIDDQVSFFLVEHLYLELVYFLLDLGQFYWVWHFCFRPFLLF